MKSSFDNANNKTVGAMSSSMSSFKTSSPKKKSSTGLCNKKCYSVEKGICVNAYETASKGDNFANCMTDSMAARANVVQAVLDSVESPAKWICYPTYLLSLVFRYLTVGMAMLSQCINLIPFCMPKEYDKDFGVANVEYQYTDGTKETGLTGTGPIAWCLIRQSLMCYTKGAGFLFAVLTPIMYLLSTLFYFLSLFPFLGVEVPPTPPNPNPVEDNEKEKDVEKGVESSAADAEKSSELSSPVVSNPMVRDDPPAEPTINAAAPTTTTTNSSTTTTPPAPVTESASGPEV